MTKGPASPPATHHDEAVRARYGAAASAHKGKQGPCYETNQAVVYRGPWRRVEDDDGHVLVRGERTAACETAR